MKAEFSEFTYGFSIVSELASALGCNAVPIFPSLKAEGSDGGGYDVEMAMGAVPLFLQFKLSEHLKTDNAKEAKHKSGAISAPYRRFAITSSNTSRQHAMLVGLGERHNNVYYCAPDFYRSDDLNYIWNRGYVTEGSVFVRPGDIGPILDDDRHTICFNGSTLAKDRCFLFSDPKPLESISGATLGEIVQSDLAEAKTPLRELLRVWPQQMDEARIEGERLHREQINAVERLMAERLQVEAEGPISTRALISDAQIVSDVTPSFAPPESYGLRSRVFGIQDELEDVDMQRLRALGRRASVEFQAQMFVLQLFRESGLGTASRP